MKKILFIIVFILLHGITATDLLYAQPQDGIRGERRIEELARIKLIETLQLDEETTVRFFSRRNEHRLRIEKLKHKKNELLDSIEESISIDASVNDEKKYKKMIQDYFDIEMEFEKERKQFITSLSDILTENEICRFLVFERNFDRELRNLLMKHRQRGRR